MNESVLEVRMNNWEGVSTYERDSVAKHLMGMGGESGTTTHQRASASHSKKDENLDDAVSFTRLASGFLRDHSSSLSGNHYLAATEHSLLNSAQTSPQP